jgi:hypothetical protein
MNYGYGSELHLLRMLGRHRQTFNLFVLADTGADAVEWLDFPSGGMRLNKSGDPTWDREWQQLSFLRDGAPAREAWAAAWPTRRTGPNWDAIGRLTYKDGAAEWLLVEAKANIEELDSDCQASDPDSLALIQETMAKTKAALGVAADRDWMTRHYQHCNRLAALHILNRNGSLARLMYVYFYGDHGSDGEGWARTCPDSAAEWTDALNRQASHIGLPPGHYLEDRIHKLFVDARLRTDDDDMVLHRRS